ncbi:MAG: hypothetical protein GF364_07140 [Candidatus Lokiarchaeota archaeon]|nr:hypothetical protein [Candidatus Lokiarchaeota archaeon]
MRGIDLLPENTPLSEKFKRKLSEEKTAHIEFKLKTKYNKLIPVEMESQIINYHGLQAIFSSVSSSTCDCNKEKSRSDTILPLCSGCRKIRVSNDNWLPFEKYMNSYLNIKFTHSLCSKCMRDLYPELVKDTKKIKEESREY